MATCNTGGQLIDGVLQGGIDEGKTANYFDYSEKNVVTIKVHDGHRLNQMNNIRQHGASNPWVTVVDEGSPKDENFRNDPVEKMSGVGKQTKKFLTKLEIHVLSDVISKIPGTEHEIQVMLDGLPEQHLVDPNPPTAKKLLLLRNECLKATPEEQRSPVQQVDHRLASNPYLSLYGDNWERELDNCPAMKHYVRITNLVEHIFQESQKVLHHYQCSTPPIPFLILSSPR